MMPMSGFSGIIIILLVFLLSGIGTIILTILFLRSIFSPNTKSTILANKKKLTIFAILVLLLDGLCIYIAIEMKELSNKVDREAVNSAKRQNFTLKKPRQYGELLLPAGTRVKRYDPFDNGEDNRAFRLTGLRRAEFPHPVSIAGVWASAVSKYGAARVTLSYDQEVSGVSCQKNHIALFSVPLIEYDPREEFGKEEPDGPDARFKPSQWVFMECMEP